MKLNKVCTSATEFFYAKLETMRNFEDITAEKDLTWFTRGQRANYSTDLHGPLFINYVCFVRMTNTELTYRHTSTYIQRFPKAIVKTENQQLKNYDKYIERS